MDSRIVLLCGHGLVVEHDLAKVETGVRFSLAAPERKNQIVGEPQR